jgi:hypothetical protein
MFAGAAEPDIKTFDRQSIQAAGTADAELSFAVLQLRLEFV